MAALSRQSGSQNSFRLPKYLLYKYFLWYFGQIPEIGFGSTRSLDLQTLHLGCVSIMVFFFCIYCLLVDGLL